MLSYLETEKRDVWAREFFLADSWLIFRGGKIQFTVNGKWEEWWEIHLGKWFWGFSDKTPIRFGKL